MLRPLDRFDARSVEEATRRFWATRSLPSAGGTVGPPAAPRVHQLFGTVSQEESPLSLVQRAVTADVDARFLAQAGRRTSGHLQVRQRGLDSDAATAGELLRRIGIWLGGGRLETVGADSAAERLQWMVERLAESNLLVSREAPFRSCPRCRVPRTPAGIVYQEANGPTYLVRFPLSGTTPRSSLLVWVDSLWKLLGTTALLVHPDQSYVTAVYRHHGSEETVVLSRSGAERLRQWLSGSDFEILSEAAGASFEGRRYDHPLSHEAPGLGSIEGPAGVLHASPEVTDTGTGVVTLVPSHGAGDAFVGRALGVAGWPILDSDLTLSNGFAHKYQGLTIDAADAFIHRDLSDGGYLFAQLTVRRGIPHCAVCDEPLVWETGRAWCLEPGRLPAERLDLLGRLLPGEPIPPPAEAIPWPVTERDTTDDESAPLLGECTACGRLASPAAGPTCACGGRRTPNRRRLLPVFQETMVTWAGETPFPAGEGLRLYIADRRLAPSVIHHLVAMEAADAHPGDVRLGRFPTLPGDHLEVGAVEPLDALRATLVGLGTTPRAGARALADRRLAEERRLAKIWGVVRDVIAAMVRDGYAPSPSPIGGRLAELHEEDRAFLSRFERLRVETLRLYEQGSLARAHARLARFFEEEVREGYLPFVRRRLEAPGLPPDKAGAYSVLAHVLPLWAELYAPIAPFTTEAIHRAFRGEGESLFERPHTPILEGVLDAQSERAYERWRSVSRALDRARRHLGLPSGAPLGKVVLFIRDEEVADGIRGSAEVLARVANVGSVEVASPNVPWEGKRINAQPVLPAIQKAFGTGTPRVVRLLSGLPGRRVQEGIRSRSLQVAVEGQPVEILPSMVEFVESLPDGIVPIPWELGELFIEAPPGARLDEEGKAPALSPDAYRLVRRVRRRLGPASLPDVRPGLVVFAHGRLADEIDRQQTALARFLGLERIRVVTTPEGFPAAETIVGRSGRGDRWMVWLPGVPAPLPRRKTRPPHEETSRVSRAPEVEGNVVDFLAASVLTRESELHEWLQRLDIVLGRPVVGPSKLRYAWEMGIHSYDELIHSPYERLAPIPGFGPYLASEIVRSFGGTVPEPPHGRREDLRVVYEPRTAPSTDRGPPSGPPGSPTPSLPIHEGPASENEPSSGSDTTPALDSSSETTGSREELPVNLDGGPLPVSPPANPLEAAASAPSTLSPSTSESTSERAMLSEGPSPGQVGPVEPSGGPPETVLAEGAAEVSVGSVAATPPPSTGPITPTEGPARDLGDEDPLRATASETQVEEAASGSQIESVPPESNPDGLASSSGPGPESSEPGVVAPPSSTGAAASSTSLAGPTGQEPEVPHAPGPQRGEGSASSSPTFPPGPVTERETFSAFPTDEGATTPSPSAEPASLPGRPSVEERSAEIGPPPPSTEPVGPPLDVGSSPPSGPSPPAPPEPIRFEIPPEAPPVPQRGVFVTSEPAEGRAWAFFLDATAAGHRGLCLSREFPDRLRALLGPRDVTIVWLSNAGRPGTAKPGDLDALLALVTTAVEGEGVTAVYVGSVEFLVRINSVQRVLDFLRRLEQVATPRSVRVWVPVNPTLASTADAEALLAAFTASGS